MKEIKTQQLKEALDKGEALNIIDVRRDDEVAEGKIASANHIVLDEISERLDELKKDETYYIICRSGGRSAKAGEYLESKGYEAINVDGGMLEWEGDTETK